ncbi:hypothetical protein [Micromonospora aurantiaca]|uniref:hypothetical protein n=1 Tax=Micromonospora aurantiaca (nom. illeg.) TaxID=47850 RepID=UPI002E17E140
MAGEVAQASVHLRHQQRVSAVDGERQGGKEMPSTRRAVPGIVRHPTGHLAQGSGRHEYLWGHGRRTRRPGEGGEVRQYGAVEVLAADLTICGPECADQLRTHLYDIGRHWGVAWRGR